MRSRRLGSAGSGASGSTQASGNNVVVPMDADLLSLEFRVTAVGATPTVTYKWQGSDDDASTAEASSDWYDLFALPSSGAAETAAGGTLTAVGVGEFNLDLHKRLPRKVRLIVSANTNVTWDSEVRAASDEE